MKKVILILAMLLTGCASAPKGCDRVLAIGAGAKMFQTKSWFIDENNDIHKRHNSGVSGRVNLALECKKIRVGYEHRSDLFQGKPFNGNLDNVTDEIYIDYVIKF